MRFLWTPALILTFCWHQPALQTYYIISRLFPTFPMQFCCWMTLLVSVQLQRTASKFTYWNLRWWWHHSTLNHRLNSIVQQSCHHKHIIKLLSQTCLKERWLKSVAEKWHNTSWKSSSTTFPKLFWKITLTNQSDLETAQIWLSGHFIKILDVNIKACRLVVKRNRLLRNTHGTWRQLEPFMRNITLSLLHVGATPLWHCLHPRATALWISVRKWQHVLKRTASASVTTNTPPHFISSILLILLCLVPPYCHRKNHTFHKTCLLQLWATKAQRRIRLGKVHAVIRARD